MWRWPDFRQPKTKTKGVRPSPAVASGGQPPGPEKMIPRSGGAGLKEILLGTGLLGDEDPSVAGRKSVVEVYTEYSKERYERMKKLKAEGKIRNLNNAHQYDFFVRVNGKTEQLSDETIQKMERSFIPWVLNWEISEGAPKNLTRMRGRGMLKFDAATAITELADCLTGEPSWLHIALQKAVEEYETPPKAASDGVLDLRDDYTLFEGAKIAGMTPYDFYREVLASTLKKVPSGSTPLWVVMDGQNELGFVTKMRNSRSTLNPYKAFVGIGHEAKFLGSFYDEDEAKKWGYDMSKHDPDMVFGGMDAAVKAVEKAAR